MKQIVLGCVAVFACLIAVNAINARHASAQTTQVIQAATTATGNVLPNQYPTQVTVLWPANFVDTSYSAVCDVEDNTTPPTNRTLTARAIHGITVSGVVVDVWNQVGATAHSGNLHCIAVHP